jgi:hypothetical protein
MLELYLPFIHDNDWTFDTSRVRALTANDDRFRFDLRDVDWCHYWVDVEYPGLRRWCIPLIDGARVPEDPPSHPPFRLQSVARDGASRPVRRAEEWTTRVASK